MNELKIIDTSVIEFSDFQALQALFLNKLKIKVIKFTNKVALEIYSLGNCFIETILMPLSPTLLEMQSLVNELKELSFSAF